MKIESRYERLERYLNRIKFTEVPMGGILADQLALTQTHGVQSTGKSFIHLFWDFSYLFFSAFTRNQMLLNTSMIATWLIAGFLVVGMLDPGQFGIFTGV
jgi:hypothetical protein